MRRDTTNQIDVFTTPSHPQVRVTISHGGAGDCANYSFVSMKHFLSHFGNMLPLTDCVFHIHSELA